MIYVGVDLHQRFCYMTALDATGRRVDHGCLANEPTTLQHDFQRWSAPMQVVAEACGSWATFVETVEPLVERIVLVHPQRVKAIAHANLKNDRVDSATLAQALRGNLLPEAWIADRATRELHAPCCPS